MPCQNSPSKRRNVVLIGHSGAGKTAIAESLLLASGATDRIGVSTEGSSHFDFEPEEIKRGSTLKTAVFDFKHEGLSCTIIDTPAAADFIADTISAIRAADTAILVASALSGVKVQGEKAWTAAVEEGIARALFITELDKERADFQSALSSIETDLEISPVVFQIPIGVESELRGVIDLLSEQAYITESPSKTVSAEIPAEYKEQAAEGRTVLIERLAELDDNLLEKYLEGEIPSKPELLAAFRTAFACGKVVPVFCGSGHLGVGNSALLDAIATEFPSPLERTPYHGKDSSDPEHALDVRAEDSELSAIVFKTFADPFTGQVSLVRVISGTLQSDTNVYNANKNTNERVGKLYVQLGKEHDTIESAGAGSIVAIAKLKNTCTGDTLTSESKPVCLDGFHFPESSISYAVEPKNRGDEDKLVSSVEKIALEDPAITILRDPTTNETIISGMGKAHIEITLERIKRKFGVEVAIHAPQVPYRETITTPTEAQGKHKKQSGGRGQYGDCWLRVQPKQRGKGFGFHSEIFGGSIPKNYIPAVEKGVVDAMKEGSVAGFPMVDVECTVYDGSYHAVDSSDMAFKIAASKGFKKAVENAKPVILEPVMTAEVVVPDEATGDVIGDLNGRRGKVLDMRIKGKYQVICAEVPLAEMLEYAPSLRSITADRGSFHMEFSSYEKVPTSVAEKIIEKRNSEGSSKKH